MKSRQRSLGAIALALMCLGVVAVPLSRGEAEPPPVATWEENGPTSSDRVLIAGTRGVATDAEAQGDDANLPPASEVLPVLLTSVDNQDSQPPPGGEVAPVLSSAADSQPPSSEGVHPVLSSDDVNSQPPPEEALNALSDTADSQPPPGEMVEAPVPPPQFYMNFGSCEATKQAQEYGNWDMYHPQNEQRPGNLLFYLDTKSLGPMADAYTGKPRDFPITNLYFRYWKTRGVLDAANALKDGLPYSEYNSYYQIAVNGVKLNTVKDMKNTGSERMNTTGNFSLNARLPNGVVVPSAKLIQVTISKLCSGAKACSAIPDPELVFISPDGYIAWAAWSPNQKMNLGAKAVRDHAWCPVKTVIDVPDMTSLGLAAASYLPSLEAAAPPVEMAPVKQYNMNLGTCDNTKQDQEFSNWEVYRPENEQRAGSVVLYLDTKNLRAMADAYNAKPRDFPITNLYFRYWHSKGIQQLSSVLGDGNPYSEYTSNYQIHVNGMKLTTVRDVKDPGSESMAAAGNVSLKAKVPNNLFVPSTKLFQITISKACSGAKACAAIPDPAVVFASPDGHIVWAAWSPNQRMLLGGKARDHAWCPVKAAIEVTDMSSLQPTTAALEAAAAAEDTPAQPKQFFINFGKCDASKQKQALGNWIMYRPRNEQSRNSIVLYLDTKNVRAMADAYNAKPRDFPITNLFFRYWDTKGVSDAVSKLQAGRTYDEYRSMYQILVNGRRITTVSDMKNTGPVMDSPAGMFSLKSKINTTIVPSTKLFQISISKLCSVNKACAAIPDPADVFTSPEGNLVWSLWSPNQRLSLSGKTASDHAWCPVQTTVEVTDMVSRQPAPAANEAALEEAAPAATQYNMNFGRCSKSRQKQEFGNWVMYRPLNEQTPEKMIFYLDTLNKRPMADAYNAAPRDFPITNLFFRYFVDKGINNFAMAVNDRRSYSEYRSNYLLYVNGKRIATVSDMKNAGPVTDSPAGIFSLKSKINTTIVPSTKLFQVIITKACTASRPCSTIPNPDDVFISPDGDVAWSVWSPNQRLRLNNKAPEDHAWCPVQTVIDVTDMTSRQPVDASQLSALPEPQLRPQYYVNFGPCNPIRQAQEYSNWVMYRPLSQQAPGSLVLQLDTRNMPAMAAAYNATPRDFPIRNLHLAYWNVSGVQELSRAVRGKVATTLSHYQMHVNGGKIAAVGDSSNYGLLSDKSAIFSLKAVLSPSTLVPSSELYTITVSKVCAGIKECAAIPDPEQVFVSPEGYVVYSLWNVQQGLRVNGKLISDNAWCPVQTAVNAV